MNHETPHQHSRPSPALRVAHLTRQEMSPPLHQAAPFRVPRSPESDARLWGNPAEGGMSRDIIDALFLIGLWLSLVGAIEVYFITRNTRQR